MATLQLTVDLQLVEGGHIQAQIVEVPAVITSTAVHEQLLDQVADALAEYLRVDRPAELPPLAVGATRVPIVLTLSA